MTETRTGISIFAGRTILRANKSIAVFKSLAAAWGRTVSHRLSGGYIADERQTRRIRAASVRLLHLMANERDPDMPGLSAELRNIAASDRR